MSTSQPNPTVVFFGEELLDRMVHAVEKVRERLSRSTQALEACDVAYAVIDGNAVAAWVSKVDPGAARNTVDVDLMVNRSDFADVRTAMESAGFVFREVLGINMFLDGPDGRPRDAVHLLFAGEKVRPEYLAAAPELSSIDRTGPYRLLGLESLVRMKLTSFRPKDYVHIQDMIGVGLIDETWTSKLQPELAARLQRVLEDPDGRRAEALLERVLEWLDSNQRAATYGAVAGVVGSTPQQVMSGKPRNHRHSWVVNARNALPTDYLDDQIDPALQESIRLHGIIRTPEDLQEWLDQNG